MSFNQSFNLFKDNWFMSLTMVFGSFIAGATSEGGGAVAFPVMTLVFNIDPLCARDFSLMIQTVGMGMASLSIYFMQIPIPWKTIFKISITGVIGIFFGLILLDGKIPAPYLKIFFTSFWLSFAYTLFKNSKHSSTIQKLEIKNKELIHLFLLSFTGGLLTSFVGTGIDIIIFSYLTLYKKVDLKIATPISVILMAINSAAGFLCKSFLTHIPLQTEAINYFLVCIPVVIFGAPFGAYFIKNRSQIFIRNLLLTTLSLQYIYSFIILKLNFIMILLSITSTFIGLILFSRMAKSNEEIL
tara:strand:+ start:82923 stop:83819 length:897 start_codon:yes stop_codon:yes gene_type:complete